MKAQIDRIKSVLATKDFGTRLNHYLFEPGWVLASDGRMVAAIPTGEDLNCLVPGPEIEAVVDRFEGDVAFSHVGDHAAGEKGYLKLRSGLLSGSIETLPPDQVSFFRPDGEWLEPPDGLVEALKLVRPFIADQAVQAWALCACLRTGSVVATNNMSIITADCLALEVDGDILVPSWAVDFVLKHAEALTGVMWNKNFAAFRWESGLWFRTQLIEGSFPPQIGTLIARPERATTAIEKAWRAVYNDVATLSEGTVRIGPTEMIGGKGKAEVRAQIATAVEVEINFNPKFLSPVLAAADFWAPEIYPAPVPFRGNGFSGVVVGRKA
jgi:hypothetical protein